MVLEEFGSPDADPLRLVERASPTPGPGEVRVRCDTVAYPLEEANRALRDLLGGRFQGAAVLHMR